MFDLDNFREIWSTIKRNKLRTFLTGFSVSWGIFMLIVLLAAGNGLKNGIIYNFRNISMNYVNVWTRYTTKPWQGMPTNRAISFRQNDLDDLKRDFKEVEYCSASINHSDTITYNKEYFTGQTEGVMPDHAIINYINVKSNNGRFINEADVKMMRKVIVLSPRMAEVLFRGKNALGEYVRCGSFMFQVVGTYEDENNSNNSPAYIPFSVAQQLYNKGYGFGSLNFTLKGVNTEAENEAFEEKLRGWMARRHQFDPTDENAIGMWNLGSEFRSFNTMMAGINLFIWIIGIGTLMAGIVGVSNIMLITVRERTKEFGIRKAIGAKPSSILMLIITESIMVTAVFGYIGMIMGIGLTEMINYGMETAQAAQSAVESSNTVGGNVSTFRDPTVNISIAISSTILIIVAGVLAGYFPARKAVKIPAVEAMRAE